MDERERAVIRRNSGGVWGTATRNDDAGCDRAAQMAFCGAVGLVALVGRAICRHERTEA